MSSKGILGLFVFFFLAGCASSNGTVEPQQGLNATSRAPTNSMQYMYRSPPVGFSGVRR